jgi:hypothetical protein
MEFWTTSIGTAKMRPMPNALGSGYEKFVNDAIEAERLGFDGYGSGEHHFMYDEFMPIPLQAVAAVASVTTKMRLATSAMLLPLYDPMEAAEIASTLDVLSGGRVSLGLGMGYRPYKLDAKTVAISSKYLKYSVFGDGPLKDPLDAKLREYGLRDQFDLHGFVDL